MKTYEELVQEYRKRQHDTVVDTLATGLTYVDEIAVDTGLLEETGLLTELTESVTGLLPFMIISVHEGSKVLLGKKPNIRLYAVKLVQERLAELGYFSADVVCDGDYGSLTTAAVKLFQMAGGLHSDGLAGAETQTLLFSEDAPRNPYAAVTPAPPKK